MTITKFRNSCHLIFSNCSKRIKSVYNNEKYSGFIDFYPNRKLIGNIINYSSLDKLTEDNPYFMTPKVLNFLVNEKSRTTDESYFKDENEVLWGDDASEYIEDLFISLILDMQKIPEYSDQLFNKDLQSIKNLKIKKDFKIIISKKIKKNIEENKKDIKSYFQSHFPSGSLVYDDLKDKFINFTYNKCDIIEIIEDNSTFSLVEKLDITLCEKNKTAYLSFISLPDKLELFVKFILLPILDELKLEDVLKEIEKQETEEQSWIYLWFYKHIFPHFVWGFFSCLKKFIPPASASRNVIIWLSRRSWTSW